MAQEELHVELEKLTEEVKHITKILESTSKTVMRDTKKLNTTRKMTTITMKDYFNTVEDGTTKMELFKQEIKEAIPSIEKMKNKMAAIPGPGGLLIKALKFAAKAIMSVGVAMIKTAYAFTDITKSIDGLEDMIDQGFADIPIVGKAMKELSKDIDANVGTFKSLAKQGASFGSSIVQLRRLQAESTMPLAKFTNLIGGNSEMLAKLFGSVDKGVPQIANLTGKLRDLTEKDFAKFGLTLDDTSGYMMSYLELERARGNTSRMSQAQLLQGTAKYTKNLVTLSKLTGKNVDELDKQNQAMAADGVFQSTLSGMSADRAKKMSLGMAGLEGPMKQFAKEIIGVGAPISDASKELEAMSGGRLGEAVKQFKKDGDLTQFQNSIKTISADVMKNSKNYGQAALVGGQFTEALNAMAKAAGEAIDPTELKGEVQAAQKDNIENLVNLGSTIDRVKTAFESAKFEVFVPAFYGAGDAVTTNTEKINESFKTLASDGIPKMVTAIKGVLSAAGLQDGGTTDTTTKDKKDGWWKRFKDWISGDGSKADASGRDLRGMGGGAQFGTGGFKNFGQGTKMMLHGSEAVVPKSSVAGSMLSNFKGFGGDVGIADMLAAMKSKAENIMGGGTDMTPAGVGGGGGGTDITQLTTVSNNILKSSTNIESHLNRLVAINMATERNTKTTNKELADMSGTLV